MTESATQQRFVGPVMREATTALVWCCPAFWANQRQLWWRTAARWLKGSRCCNGNVETPANILQLNSESILYYGWCFYDRTKAKLQVLADEMLGENDRLQTSLGWFFTHWWRFVALRGGADPAPGFHRAAFAGGSRRAGGCDGPGGLRLSRRRSGSAARGRRTRQSARSAARPVPQGKRLLHDMYRDAEWAANLKYTSSLIMRRTCRVLRARMPLNHLSAARQRPWYASPSAAGSQPSGRHGNAPATAETNTQPSQSMPELRVDMAGVGKGRWHGRISRRSPSRQRRRRLRLHLPAPSLPDTRTSISTAE